LVFASIGKFCGQAAMIAAIIFGGLVMGALTPAYSSETSTAGVGAGDTAATARLSS
jgi:hypothetical protein